MYEELDETDGDKKPRRKSIGSRTRPPRAARTSSRKRSTAAIGGSHKRRNKHWSW